MMTTVEQLSSALSATRNANRKAQKASDTTRRSIEGAQVPLAR
jgi:hypothetical protein